MQRSFNASRRRRLVRSVQREMVRASLAPVGASPEATIGVDAAGPQGSLPIVSSNSLGCSPNPSVSTSPPPPPPLIPDDHSSNISVEIEGSDSGEIEEEIVDSDSSESESGENSGFSELRIKLANIVFEEGFSDRATKRILGLLRGAGHEDLPKTRVTLLNTPRDKIVTRPVPPGEYLHFGIEKFLLTLPSNSPIKDVEEISLDINMDGLPVFGKTQKLWPIQGAFSHDKTLSPFLIGAYSGSKDPQDVNLFLEDFIAECNKLILEGVLVTNSRVYKPFRINMFCCDAPARAMISGTQYHRGHNACPKCDQVAQEISRRSVYATCSANPRTDDSFRGRLVPAHHHSMDPIGIEKIPTIDMVKQIALDPMHVVYLGVGRRFVRQLYAEPCINFKLRPAGRIHLNNFYSSLAPFIPYEFARKPRSFEDLGDWKATEFRLFCLYTGVVTFQVAFPGSFFNHFLLLFCALRLLSKTTHPVIPPDDIQMARSLLEKYVSDYPNFYGNIQVGYNVHCLLHIADCANDFGPLPYFSAFKFENFMQTIKKNIRKKHQLLPQLNNRNAEKAFLDSITRPVPPSQFSQEFKLRRPLFGGNFAYKTCAFSRFKISANQADGCCLIRGEIPVSVIGFGTREGSQGLIGQRYRNPTPFFLNPINSLLIGVMVVEEFSHDGEEVFYQDVEFFPLSEVTHKMIRIPYESGYVLIELLHILD